MAAKRRRLEEPDHNEETGKLMLNDLSSENDKIVVKAVMKLKNVRFFM